jgi:hypothetical protein
MTHLYVVQIFRSAVSRPDGLPYTQALQVIVAPAGRTRWRGSMGLGGREFGVRRSSAREPNRSQTEVLRDGGDPCEVQHGDVPQAAFDAGHVGAIEPGKSGERFL